ncbi:unnamed protein product [Rangifer tarandus platyrhynchus]|uniref:Uncharacterized protein n=1 Tax=Rangifer tarandus platyrhynchus TaxID=3082113 RepID=A0AC59ZAK7_RANTA
MATRKDSASVQRKQWGLYGPRGWTVHSVRGQLSGQCGPRGWKAQSQHQGSSLDSGLRVCCPCPHFCAVAFGCLPDAALGVTGTVVGRSPRGSTTLRRGR